MSSAANRAAYSAQTPRGSVFDNDSIPLNYIDDDDGYGALRIPAYDDAPSYDEDRTQRLGLKSMLQDIYKHNVGLGMVGFAGASAFMMSTLVKNLNGIDPPVPMLEVS